MKREIELAGKTHRVELVERTGELTIDGQPLDADAREIAPGLYSILIDGGSFEVRVEPLPGGVAIRIGDREFTARTCDPRKWKKGGSTGHSADGRQNVAAPMPGRIVRVLVRAGDQIHMGEGVAVVEAMKMQNEVRSPKSGRIERVLVAEGQAVNAGETIAVVV